MILPRWYPILDIGFGAVDVEALSALLAEAIIKWVAVGADSSLAGETLGDCDVREQTGATVVVFQ